MKHNRKISKFKIKSKSKTKGNARLLIRTQKGSGNGNGNNFKNFKFNSRLSQNELDYENMMHDKVIRSKLPITELTLEQELQSIALDSTQNIQKILNLRNIFQRLA
jgi:hypothetical protein